MKCSEDDLSNPLRNNFVVFRRIHNVLEIAGGFARETNGC
jgi:hypothetical protein